jgi:predicted RNA binding protein YcfA (HicA-like mRNA interferase family)
MTRKAKLIQRLFNRPKDFTWGELAQVLNSLGYEQINGSGSARKFIHPNGHLILLHEPHPRPELKRYAIEYVTKLMRKNHGEELDL